MSASDEALAGLLNQYNIDPSLLAGPTQGGTPFTSGPQADTKVYTGTKKVTTEYTTTSPKKLFGDINATPGAPTYQDQKEYTSLEGKLGEFYNLTPQQRADIQKQLFVGGFFPTSVNAEDIGWGTPDETSYSAWTRAVARTALMNQAGQDVTVEDILSQAAATGIGMEQRKEAAGSGPRVVVSDPASLALLANDTAQKVLGRKATQDEQRAIIAAVQSHQASFSTGGRAETPDPTAAAETMLREQNAVEAGAHDYAGTMNTFIKMLGGIQ